MAFGGNAPASLTQFWSAFLDDARDLAEHYTSEEAVREELRNHPDVSTHTTTAVELWRRARLVNEEILDSNAVQRATDNYAERSKTTSTSEIVAQMRPKRKADISLRAANKPQKPRTQLKQDDPRKLILDIWRSIGSKGSKWIPASTEDLEEQGDIFLKSIKQFKEPSLHAHLRGLKRWYKWLDEYCFLKQKTVAVHEPSVLVVGTFLSSAGKGARCFCAPCSRDCTGPFKS